MRETPQKKRSIGGEKKIIRSNKAWFGGRSAAKKMLRTDDRPSGRRRPKKGLFNKHTKASSTSCRKRVYNARAAESTPIMYIVQNKIRANLKNYNKKTPFVLIFTPDRSENNRNLLILPD
uniref:Uncharacterized protein n=1 Tax=Cacopsylla melanoneura TaxID=428564 RepID=A0A8D8UT00_9HEMI